MAKPTDKSILLLKIFVLLAAILTYYLCPGVQQFVNTTAGYLQSRNFKELRLFILSYGIWAPLTSICIMALQSLVPFVPGLMITIANALIFEWQLGALYSWIGALTGAMLDFGIARWYGRPVAEKFISARYLDVSDTFFAKHGVMAVFITRLTPIVPFKVVSYGAGLTNMEPLRFAIATGIGQTPAIVLYSILSQNLTKSSYTLIAVSLIIISISILAYYCRDIIERNFFSDKD